MRALARLGVSGGLLPLLLLAADGFEGDTAPDCIGDRMLSECAGEGDTAPDRGLTGDTTPDSAGVGNADVEAEAENWVEAEAEVEAESIDASPPIPIAGDEGDVTLTETEGENAGEKPGMDERAGEIAPDATPDLPFVPADAVEFGVESVSRTGAAFEIGLVALTLAFARVEV